MVLEIRAKGGRFGPWARVSQVMMLSVATEGAIPLCPLKIDLISIIQFATLHAQHQCVILHALLETDSLPSQTEVSCPETGMVGRHFFPVHKRGILEELERKKTTKRRLKRST